MKIVRPDLALGLIAAIALVGIVVLTALGHAVPGILPDVAIGALTAGAGVAVQGTSSSTTDPTASRIADALTSIEALVEEFSGKKTTVPTSTPTAAAVIPAQPAAAAVSTPVGAA